MYFADFVDDHAARINLGSASSYRASVLPYRSCRKKNSRDLLAHGFHDAGHTCNCAKANLSSLLYMHAAMSNLKRKDAPGGHPPAKSAKQSKEANPSKIVYHGPPTHLPRKTHHTVADPCPNIFRRIAMAKRAHLISCITKQYVRLPKLTRLISHHLDSQSPELVRFLAAAAQSISLTVRSERKYSRRHVSL